MKYIKLAVGVLQTVFCVATLVLVTRNKAIWFVTMLAGVVPPLLAAYVLVLGLTVCAAYMILTSGAKSDMANYVLLFLCTAVICCGLIAVSAHATGPSVFDWIIVVGLFDFLIGVLGLVGCWMRERDERRQERRMQR